MKIEKIIYKLVGLQTKFNKQKADYLVYGENHDAVYDHVEKFFINNNDGVRGIGTTFEYMVDGVHISFYYTDCDQNSSNKPIRIVDSTYLLRLSILEKEINISIYSPSDTSIRITDINNFFHSYYGLCDYIIKLSKVPLSVEEIEEIRRVVNIKELDNIIMKIESVFCN